MAFWNSAEERAENQDRRELKREYKTRNGKRFLIGGDRKRAEATERMKERRESKAAQHRRNARPYRDNAEFMDAVQNNEAFGKANSQAIDALDKEMDASFAAQSALIAQLTERVVHLIEGLEKSGVIDLLENGEFDVPGVAKGRTVIPLPGLPGGWPIDTSALILFALLLGSNSVIGDKPSDGTFFSNLTASAASETVLYDVVTERLSAAGVIEVPRTKGEVICVTIENSTTPVSGYSINEMTARTFGQIKVEDIATGGGKKITFTPTNAEFQCTVQYVKRGYVTQSINISMLVRALGLAFGASFGGGGLAIAGALQGPLAALVGGKGIAPAFTS